MVEQFDFYALKHGLGAEDTSHFDKTKRIRDNAVHGDLVDVTLEIGREAEQLLRAMLKTDFELTDELPWEKQPLVYGMRLGFELVPADQAATDRGRGTGVEPDVPLSQRTGTTPPDGK